MNSKKLLPYGALVVGSLLALIGLGFSVMYLLEAVINRLGDPDQSLLFWYLPLLFIGLIGIIAGVGIGAIGAIRLKQLNQQDTNPEN